tara:strand:+ start:2340 stop:5105 length:2766 start_codon:yes stop_codon:yes gene_type:complete
MSNTKSKTHIDEYRNKYGFYTTPLVHNSKRPAESYKIIKETHKTKNMNCRNYGILTGKIPGIIGVDLDIHKPAWHKEEPHSFIKTFGVDYIKRFNTLTQSTISGGIHLIFQYDEDVKQTQNEEYEIDIRSDGGYLVGAGSTINDGSYKVKKSRSIKPLPEDLKKYLLETLYTTETILKNEKKKKQKENINIHYAECDYSYSFTTEEIENCIVKKLPEKYFNDYTYWLKFMTCMKVMGQYELADKYRMVYRDSSSKWNDKNYFNTAYNVIDSKTGIPIVEHILAEILQPHLIPYLKYKSLPSQLEKPTMEISTKKLGYELELKDDVNYIIKSDTGTGKTTLFKNYIKTKPFISIVSRVSLADEQYRVFNEAGVDCGHYKLVDSITNKESIIITIDSIMKLIHLDFSKYVIFMDEFNSICEYILQADVCLGDKRSFIMKVLTTILKSAKQVISVDADITDLCFKIFRKLDIDCEYIVNDFKHNAGVKSYEIFEIEKIIEQINDDRAKGIAVMVCCDSKTMAEFVHDKTGRLSCLITNETTKAIVFDEEPFIIFSPKIIYGIDGNWEGGRNVYCVYKGGTISPKNMVQQFSRERNINNLYYFFNLKKFVSCQYANIGECRDDMVIKHKNALIQFELLDGSYNDLFFDMLVEYEYKMDCYNTNKFLHFLEIIKSRGIENITNRYFTSPVDNDEVNETAGKLRKDNFDIDSEYIQTINGYLNMDPKYIEENKSLFINPHMLCNHFTICDYFIKNQETDKLYEKLSSINEFPIKKLVSLKNKILNVKRLKELSGYQETVVKDKIFFTCSKALTEEASAEFNTTYRLVFGGRCKTIDLTNVNNISKMISKMVGNFCSDKIIDSVKTRVGKKTINKLYIDNKKIQEHRRIYNLRQTKNSLIQNYAGINITVEEEDVEWECDETDQFGLD